MDSQILNKLSLFPGSNYLHVETNVDSNAVKCAL